MIIIYELFIKSMSYKYIFYIFDYFYFIVFYSTICKLFIYTHKAKLYYIVKVNYELVLEKDIDVILD